MPEVGGLIKRPNSIPIIEYDEEAERDENLDDIGKKIKVLKYGDLEN
jgi:hypothetical protein